MKLAQNILLLITIFSLAHSVDAQEKSKQDILTSLGKVSKWNSINYILFTSSNANHNLKERSFLIDKFSGKVRFEGKTNNSQRIVLLFNYKTKVLDKAFINGKLAETKPLALYQEVTNQLFDDTKLLFLPMLVISSPNSTSIGTGKINNSEKLIEINFNNILNMNKQSLEGSIYLNTKGDIKEYELNQSVIIVNDIKDIGDGIFLPTRFSCLNNSNLSVKFNTVAAFTDIEVNKFTNL